MDKQNTIGGGMYVPEQQVQAPPEEPDEELEEIKDNTE